MLCGSVSGVSDKPRKSVWLSSSSIYLSRCYQLTNAYLRMVPEVEIRENDDTISQVLTAGLQLQPTCSCCNDFRRRSPYVATSMLLRREQAFPVVFNTTLYLISKFKANFFAI